MTRPWERVRRDVLSVPMSQGSVLLHVPSGRYLHANESAAAIVGLLAEGNSPSEVARRFAASNGLSVEAGEADVRSLLERLEGLSRSSGRRVRRPQIRSSVREMARWWRLPAGLRWAVVQGAVILGVVELGLRTMDLRRLSGLLRAPLSDGRGLMPAVSGRLADLRPAEQRVLCALEWLDGRWFVPLTCLRRALVTGWVLRRRHPALRLGVTGGGATAHAWIEAEGYGYGVEDVEEVFGSPA